ncbi:PucR family transcriptional regulator [Salinibacterium sp. ZJ450]|uniref:PucR family transcriptional regulator n=1 Tax=Salinibacterium sp. ZJ450 TaxID=2708338 RepID=UPI0014208C0D|nr:PucR family transcriptional regulator [Salinibacterium sp. ZJ450]
MNSGDYTLGDLLNEPHLGLELLTGSHDVLATSVTGAHTIELEHPAKWLDRGWMMLTMGVRLRNKPPAQRALITELRDLGASCLGFGTGLAFKSVPPALLDEASRQNFPIVLVPEQTQFREVTRAVFHSTLSIESTSFRRLTSIQQNLIRAFADPDPLESLVQRLGRVVHSTVAVLSVDGRVDLASGAIPVSDIAAQLDDFESLPLAQFDAAGWQVIAAPVSTKRGSSARWLVVASRGGTVARELARAAVQVTAPLIDAILRLNVTDQGQNRAVRKAILDSALEGTSDETELRMLDAKFAELGINFASEFRTVVLRQRPGGLNGRVVPSPDAVVSWLYTQLEVPGVSYLLSQRRSEIVLILETNAALDDLVFEVSHKWPALTVGVGRPLLSVRDVQTSHRDAQVAAQHATIQADRPVLCFDGLDMVTQLLAEVPFERFQTAAAPLASVLADNPIQLEALRAYFAANRDVKVAADSIFLHPNTLRYRLERLEQALGRSLREPSVTASLYCVLTMMSDVLPAAGSTYGQTAEEWTASPSLTGLSLEAG